MDNHRYNKPWDKHMRRTSPAGYYDNRRDGNQAFPGVDMSGWTLREIREYIRGRDNDDKMEEYNG